ncbi:hypothetical protein FDUTEX481_03585 [Tolypothrix sp. PCC 7601]|nr:hypothetical protein FDUTEX481_03585 [Tolypothrix sp. PCC 7601]
MGKFSKCLHILSPKKLKQYLCFYDKKYYDLYQKLFMASAFGSNINLTV